MCRYFQSPVKIRTKQQLLGRGKGPPLGRADGAAWALGKVLPTLGSPQATSLQSAT